MMHGLSAPSLSLVLASSCAWAGVDLLRKWLGRSLAPLPLLFVLTAGAAPLFALWAVLGHGLHVSPGYLAPAITSVLLNVLANLLFLEALRSAPLSLTVPLLSFTPAFAALLAVPLLGERPTLGDGVGILLVIGAAFVLNAPVFERNGLGRWLRSAVAERGPWLMAGTAFLWSLTIPLDKLAVGRSSPPLHATVLNVGVAAIAFGLLALRGELREVAAIGRRPWMFLAALAVQAVALGAQLVALQTVWVSLVEIFKRAIGNLFALVAGRVAFGEPITARKVAAVLVMALGVALILV